MLRKIQKNLRRTTRTLTLDALKKPEVSRRLFNLWLPLVGAGIYISHISPDWASARLEIRLRPWNQNMHGAVFGGTLFAMTDVMFGTMIMGRLGDKYEAWTRTGEFQYISPGRNGAYLDVEVSDKLREWIVSTVEEDGYCNVPYTSVVRNRDGSVVGIGQQDLHVRLRKGSKRVESPKHARVPRGLLLESLATAVVWHCFHDRPERLTRLLSEQRRIAEPEEQMKYVVKVALSEGAASKEALTTLGVPEAYCEV